jgi:hypothetical protein
MPRYKKRPASASKRPAKVEKPPAALEQRAIDGAIDEAERRWQDSRLEKQKRFPLRPCFRILRPQFAGEKGPGKDRVRAPMCRMRYTCANKWKPA